MSFDIFLQCFRDGEMVNLDRAIFEEILGRDATEFSKSFDRVIYADGGSDIYGAKDEDEIGSLMFNHSGGDTFFERLHELADRTMSVIHWPSEPGVSAVTREETIPHLPDDFKETLPPQLVANGRELVECIRKS
jgi:hypothetical protein